MNEIITIKPRNDFTSEIPEALMAVNSELSPKLPNVINDDNNIANGKACGTNINPKYPKNSAKTSIDKPFPTSLSTYFHKDCIISTTILMTNVPAKSIPNCFAMNISNFLIRNIFFFGQSYTYAQLPCKST